MSELFNFKKGDKVTVVIEPGSNESRRVNMSLNNIENWTYPGEVVAVSKKYITVNFGVEGNTKFVVDDCYRNKYTSGGADYRLYPSFEYVYNKFKSIELRNKIKTKLDDNSEYNLETLEEIMQLLESSKNTKVYRYHLVYSYGDCEEEMFIKANSKEEAKKKLIDFKINLGDTEFVARDKDIKELSFNDSGICMI